jgi:hypothetical protein
LCISEAVNPGEDDARAGGVRIDGSLPREDDAAMDFTSRPTDVSLRIKCPNCGHTLSLLAGRSQLTFHCRNGHLFPMRQLFQTQAHEIQRGLRAVLTVWEDKAVVLKRIVEQAKMDRRVDMASSFQHEVEQIEIRIRTLKDHLRDSAEESVSGSAAG